jgi:hypothetical protein
LKQSRLSGTIHYYDPAEDKGTDCNQIGLLARSMAMTGISSGQDFVTGAAALKVI